MCPSTVIFAAKALVALVVFDTTESIYVLI
jgi:hypothetical protein